MATPRKRFAAIETTLLREEWPDAIKLTMVLLTLHLSERWAVEGLTAEQATTCRLSHGDALNVTSTETLDAARERLSELSKVVSMTFEARGQWTEIRWPKVAITQGWSEIDKRRHSATQGKDSGDTARASPEQRPSASASASATALKQERAPAAPAEWALESARILKESVGRRWPGAPVPGALTAWARELERIKADPEQVAAAMLWYASKARDAQPYLPECRCGRTFREKYSQVLAARKRGGVTGVTEASGKPRRYFEAEPRVGGIDNPGAAIGNLLRDARVTR